VRLQRFRSFGIGAFGLAVLASVSGLVRRAEAANYYVSASADSCSSPRPGTRTSPYCTISAALAAHHTPGTRIFVMPGIYREQVTIPTSGSPGGNSIVIQGVSQDGQPVVIDGSDDFANPSLWTLVYGTVWLAASVDWSPLQVFADDARLTGSSPAGPDQLQPGSFSYVAGAGLYVNLGGDNPGLHKAAVGHRQYGFYVSNRSWISIAGFTVTRAENRGIQLTNGSHDVDLNHNVVTLSGRFGVQLENSSTVHFGSNIVSDNSDHGVSITAGSSGCTIEDNECTRNGVPAKHSGDGIYLYGSTANVLQRNNIHDNLVSGVDFQVGANDNVSVQNRSWNNGLTGYNHIGATGNLHNCDVAFGNNWDGFALDSGSSGSTIYNCIATVNGLVHSRYNLEVDSTSTAGLTSNDNVFWFPSGETPVRYASTTYQWVKDYTAVSGQDTRTIQLDPLFVDPKVGDFHLLPGSPAIDAANTATPYWPAVDAEGQPRIDDKGAPNEGLGPIADADRGALEFSPGGDESAPPDTVPRFDHIIFVIMENKAYNTVRFAPYTADLIAHSSSLGESYAYAHQSQSDYYAIWGAIGRPVTESICPAVGSPYYTENLGHTLEANGVTWRGYAEDLPGPGDPICQKRNYVRRHVPSTDWGNLNHANERPYEDLAKDIANDSLPQFSFVVPNLCNDTHNYCGQDTIKIGDDWLSNNVPAMIQAVGPRGLVIVTWDEDDGSDGNHILTVLASPLAKAGYISKRFTNFFVLMRTICDGLGVPAFAEAVAQAPITDVWIKASTPPPPPPPPPPAKSVALGPAIPNPSNGSMTATLELPSPVHTVATIYDLTGRRVKTLISGPLSGQIQISWDGTDESGRAAHSGIYMLHVRAGSTSLEKKLFLVR
jgi:acid phosphatase